MTNNDPDSSSWHLFDFSLFFLTTFDSQLSTHNFQLTTFDSQLSTSDSVSDDCLTMPHVQHSIMDHWVCPVLLGTKGNP
jgi:hypothetical protein